LSGEQKREVPALNQVGAREGDRVLMALPRKAVLGAGFLVYIAPIIALIAGAVLGRTLAPAWGWDGQTGAVIAGLAFLVICWLILRRVSRLLGRRRDFSVRIVRVIRKGETHALEQHPVGL
jgi:sigma-E factor negative regulatory protein RseC